MASGNRSRWSRNYNATLWDQRSLTIYIEYLAFLCSLPNVIVHIFARDQSSWYGVFIMHKTIASLASYNYHEKAW